MSSRLGGRALVLLSLTGLAVSTPSRAVQPVLITEMPNPEPTENASFGKDPAGLGDLDGDGIDDIAVPSVALGIVWVLSGVDGTPIFRLTDPDDETDQPCETSEASPNTCNFGFVVANVHDLDGDEIEDFAIGAPGPIGGLAPACLEPHTPPGEPPPPEPKCNHHELGRVLVYSGATGTVRWHFGQLPQTPPQFGVSLVGLGDVDGDGLGEFTIGHLGSGGTGGAVTLVSLSADDVAIRWTTSPHLLESFDAFSRLQTSIGDVTDDGWPELLVSSDKTLVYVLSGVDGDILRIHEDPHEHTDPFESASFGYKIAALGDQDGDGRSEYAVAEPGESFAAGSLVHVFDGATGDLVDTLSSPVDARGSQLSLASTGDYDDDGLADLWVGNSGSNSVALMTAAGTTLATLSSPPPDSNFGAFLAEVGPLSPGPPDLVVGATGQTVAGFAGAGSVYLVRRDRAPDCTEVAADPTLIWSPTQAFVSVTISGVEDPEGGPIAITVTSIRQDEPVGSDADGLGVGTATASVRAQRDGAGDGRVYHIGFEASDEAGGTCAGTVQVGVPHDQKGLPVGDGGPLYDSSTL